MMKTDVALVLNTGTTEQCNQYHWTSQPSLGVRELEADTSREVTGETKRLRIKCWGESSAAVLQVGS